MPLRFEFKRTYSSLSERVKATDLHPSEPWLLVALYNGQINIHNYETQTIVKNFECGPNPVRTAIFVARKNWVVSGSDDLIIRIFNYHTLEKVHGFEAHVDYIRCIIAHATKPLLISCGDDMTIKVWDWEKRWDCVVTMEGHTHYVMQVVLNPKDHNHFCSASLDKKIKIWQIGSKYASYTLEGHDKGVNSVDYCNSGDKPYLISAADDWNIKVWDYQNKTCVHTLSGHTNNVIRAIFHPNLPLIISISEDGSAKVWNNSTFRCEATLNYGMGRMWSISSKKDSNEIVLGFDDGILMLRAGKEAPTCCMDLSGKIFIAKQNHISQANAKNVEYELKDGDKIDITLTEMGTCEIYPQALVISPNGRFLTVLGDGEFVIYTTIALRSKFFATGDRFAWNNNSTSFVIKDSSNLILYKNFKEYKRILPKILVDDIFPGELIALKSSSEIHFYEWSELFFIIVIDVAASLVLWNPSSTLCCLCESNTIHILKYDASILESVLNESEITDRGLENVFEPFSQVSECVVSGIFVDDCLMLTTKNNRLCYVIGDQLFIISHTERSSYVIGYINNLNRIFLVDKEGSVLSFRVDMCVIEFEMAILKKDFESAQKMLYTIPKNSLGQISLFLENQELYEMAMEVTTDLDHKFDLAIRLNDLDKAFSIASELNEKNKWVLLGKTATSSGKFEIAKECYLKLRDSSALLLLSISLNDADLLETTLKIAQEEKNAYLQFVVFYITGRTDEAISLLMASGMDAQAAIMAYTHSPKMIQETFENWQTNLRKLSPRQADLLADPFKYPNLFQDYNQDNLHEKLENLNIT